MQPVTAHIEDPTPSHPDVTALRLRRGSRDLTWSEVLGGLQTDSQLRQALSTVLAESSLEAFFWETVPVSRGSRDQTFRSVLVPAPSLARVPVDSYSFAGPLAGATSPDVRTFPNLGRDAQLVVPAPATDPATHSHLAVFLRNAPSAQVHRLWQAVGSAVDQWLSTSIEPVWVSTSGAGVAWLHVRLDRRPKYIMYAPFRRL